MCTIHPDLAAYLLNYQSENCNEVGKCSSANYKSRFNTIRKEKSRIECRSIPKRRNRKSECHEKSRKSNMVEPVVNNKRHNISMNPISKKQRVSQVLTGQNNSTNNFLSNESVLKLFNYEEAYTINTSFTSNKNIESDFSRYIEMEKLGFYSDVSENGIDSDSDEGSDVECFTDDQLAMIETVMSHDNTMEDTQREILSRNGYQHGVYGSLITLNNNNTLGAKDTGNISQNSTLILVDIPESCTYGNVIQNVNHKRSGEEMIPDENKDQETCINTPRNEVEIIDSTLQPLSCQQENPMESLDAADKSVSETTQELKSNSNTYVEMNSLLSSNEEYCSSSVFNQQQSELVESAKSSQNIYSPSEIIQGDNNIKCLSQEIKQQNTSFPSHTKQSDQGHDPALDSDCEIRSIRSVDSDLFSRKEVNASTPMQSTLTTNAIDNVLFDTAIKFDIHQNQQKVMSKQAIDYLMQMDEDNVDDAIDNMLSKSQFPKFIGLNPFLFPHNSSISPCNEDKQNISSDQEDGFEDMILEPEVCEVTVDNGITDPSEDLPFLPPERKATDTITQEKCPGTNPNLTTNNPKALQNNVKKTCKGKAPMIQGNIASKLQKDRTATQSKPKGKKCALMTEIKKQQLLAEYISGKQMQLVIPFLAINSKKKNKFKVLPRKTTLLNEVIDKSSSELKISKSMKDNGDIEPSSHFFTGITRHTQQSTNGEKHSSEDLTANDKVTDKAKLTDASFESERNSMGTAPKNINDEKNHDFIIQDSDNLTIYHECPSDSKMDKGKECQISKSKNPTIQEQAHQVPCNFEKDQLKVDANINQDSTLNNERNEICLVEIGHANGISSNRKKPFPTCDDSSKQIVAISGENNCPIKNGSCSNHDDNSIDANVIEDHHTVFMESICALHHARTTIAKMKTAKTSQVESVSKQALPKSIDKGFDNELSKDKCLYSRKDKNQEEEVTEPTSKERHHEIMDPEKSVMAMKHSEDNVCTQTKGDSAARNCRHADCGCHEDTLQQEKELDQGYPIELSPKQSTSTGAVSVDVYSCESLPIREEDLIKEKNVDVTIRDDTEMSISGLDGDILGEVDKSESSLCEEKDHSVNVTSEEESMSNTIRESGSSSSSIITTNHNNHSSPIQESEHCIEQSIMQLTSKDVNPEECVMPLNDSVKKETSIEGSMQTLTECNQSDQSDVFLNCNVFIDTSRNTRPEQSSAKDNAEPRESNDAEHTTSCDFVESCKDILHQGEPKSKKDEKKLFQNNSMDLSCSYLDLSSNEINTVVRKRTLRKRKSKKFKNSNVSPECLSEGGIELKKPRQILKEKAIKYYKEKIKKLKKENEQYKDKSLVIDFVSNFKNEITQLKKSIEMLQKKTEEQEAIIQRQESYMQRLGHEVSSGNLQNQTPRSCTRHQIGEDRQDATITSSDNNEC